ncbi:MAG: hypothetical protein PHC99_03495 [Methylococcales bacterium]|nr:hypothetical protein [Methylococcales bacterium]
MSAEEETENSKKSGIKVVIIAVIAVVGLWFVTLFVGIQFFNDWQTRGQFGDLFGSVNSLFSGLAFAALIYTIYLQRQELALQRIELKLQRDEMVASRGELAAQVAIQKALYKATIAQIRVSAEQARVDMYRTQFGGSNYKTDPLVEMDLIAKKIDKMANELESSIEK